MFPNLPDHGCGFLSRCRVPIRALALVAACVGPTARAASPPALQAVGVENEYADVIRQVGGRDVSVRAIETDPNTDPHAFEVSPAVASLLASAALVVENGVGYDGWADKIMAASPRATRHVVNVQHLLSLPDDTRNPHLWYDPKTMPAVASAVAADLAALLPAEASVFRANAARFVASLRPWVDAIDALEARHPAVAVAVTEPVADYMLEAAGCDIRTPYTLQAAIMNGTDPAPQDVTAENALFTGHKVKVFVYNQQVTDSLTQSFLHLAKTNGIPVVGVYETMPTPGFDYQRWMVAEVAALRRAVETGQSTETLAGDRRGA